MGVTQTEKAKILTQKDNMSGNEKSGRKKEGPTFIVRVRLPLKFEKLLQKEADKLGLSQNQMAKIMIIKTLA